MAQYLRKSTDRQEYSLDNQAELILKYAEEHGFTIVRTYADTGKSGLSLSHRTGLCQLLNDVVSGSKEFKAILVYDVSRWGRFQDMDEAAHYEYLCKTAGIPVYYCAEQFGADNSVSAAILKALKRTMAGEYSRELGVKVAAGARRLAQLGFKQGSRAGYGFNRLLLSHDGRPKQLLKPGEWKTLSTDRVTLVHGSAQEVATMRWLFYAVANGRADPKGLALELNSKGIKSPRGSEWTSRMILRLLRNPKYMGTLVYGCTSNRLHTPKVPVARERWVVAPGAFPPIVAEETFQRAQQALEERTCKPTDEQLLAALRKLLLEKGRLSRRIIKSSPHMYQWTVYRRRFGSLAKAYELVKYEGRDYKGRIARKRNNVALREQLVQQILELFGSRVELMPRTKRISRPRLLIDKKVKVSVSVARCFETPCQLRWEIIAGADPSDLALVARMPPENEALHDFYLLRPTDHPRRFRVSEDTPRLRKGRRFASLNQFLKLALEMAGHRRTPPF